MKGIISISGSGNFRETEMSLQKTRELQVRILDKYNLKKHKRMNSKISFDNLP